MNKISATQTVYGRNGDLLFHGEWDSKKLCEAITAGNPDYWKGRSVLDMGANTGGLSRELARMGANVTAAQPDPYRNSKIRTVEMLKEIIWYPTRDLFKAMLISAGYSDVQPLTDETFNFPKKPEGLTNSAYFKAIKLRKEPVDPIEARKVFYPR